MMLQYLPKYVASLLEYIAATRTYLNLVLRGYFIILELLPESSSNGSHQYLITFYCASSNLRLGGRV
jgi:hypothetical protein